MVSLGEEFRKLRARHKTAWMLDWDLGRVVGKGLDYKGLGFFLGVCWKRK